MPSNVALDVVANRVWPTIMRVTFCRPIFAPPQSRSAFARTSLLKSVRFMFTTRLLAPRSATAAPSPRAFSRHSSNVTTPPLCAPRIIVTYTIFSNKSNARFPRSLSHHAAFIKIIPKFPHSTVPRARGSASSTSVHTASRTVAQHATRSAALVPLLSPRVRVVAAAAAPRLASAPAHRTIARAFAHDASSSASANALRRPSARASVAASDDGDARASSAAHASKTATDPRRFASASAACARTCASSCATPARA